MLLVNKLKVTPAGSYFPKGKKSGGRSVATVLPFFVFAVLFDIRI